MADYLLDTNHASWLMANDSMLDSLSQSPQMIENTFGISMTVLAELCPIPPMDAQIAAVARVNRLTVLTADRHFQFVDRLTTENWLKS